jgi:hypothetical protein
VPFRGSAHLSFDKIKAAGLANARGAPALPSRLIAAICKENRAGWPGFFCVELDAVTSQRAAVGEEVGFLTRILRQQNTNE